MSKHLVITVHGIRTYGQWASRLSALLKLHSAGIETINYTYGYFSFIAFLVPPLRWLVTRRFRATLVELLTREHWDRVDIVAHSFGTHIVGWSLQNVRSDARLKINTVILAGSVLRSRFRWDDLIPHTVGRLINECGTRDGALIMSQLFVLMTGMAGRVGFSGALGSRFQNRYFDFGHSGYFVGDEFMRLRWIPLLTEPGDIVSVDERPPLTWWRGISDTLLNNAEPIKVSSYFGMLVGVVVWISGLLLLSQVSVDSLEKQVSRSNQLLTLAREQLVKTLVGVGQSKLDGKPHEAVRFAEAASKLTQGLEPADLLAAAVAKYPVFNRVAPEGARLDRKTLDTGYQSDFDEFAVDPGARLVVGLRSADTERSKGSGAERVLVLRSVETGEERSSRLLRPDERFIAPNPSIAWIVMTREGVDRDFRVRAFDLAKQDLSTPAFEIAAVVSVSTTKGNWPVYVLKADGQVLQFDSGASTPRQSMGRWPSANSLSVHPETGAVAVLDAQSVTILSKDRLKEISSFEVPDREEFGLIWGPREDTVLIARGEPGSSGEPAVSAIFGGRRTPEGLWKSQDETYKSGVQFVRTRGGSRILVPDRLSKGELPVVRVLDIVWPALGDVRTKPKIRVASLVGSKPQTSYLEIHALAATDDGKLVSVSQSVTALGGTTLDTSQTEIWDLTVLDGQSNLVPQSILLRSGDSVVQRASFAQDHSRLIVWDTSKIAHVFIIDRDLQDRIRPAITARSASHVQVDFGRTGRRVYNVQTGKSVNWPIRAKDVIAEELEEDGSRMFVANRSGVTMLSATGATQRVDTGFDVTGALTRGDAWLLYSVSDLLIFHTDSMTKLGQVQRSPELLQLLESLREVAQYTSILKSADGFSLCVRVKSEKIECWVLSGSADGEWKARKTLSYPFSQSPDDRFILAKMNRPFGLDVIFIASVTSDNNRQWNYRFGAYSVSTGMPVSDYAFPDLPDDFRGIEWSNVSRDYLTLMSFYGGDGGWRNAFCTFPRQGGKCEKWVPLPTHDEVAYNITGEDGRPLVLMLSYSDRGQLAKLVRPVDGKVLWSGQLLRPNIVPSLAPDGEFWSPRHLDSWRSVSREVALGGDPNVFDNVTRLQASDLDDKAIEEISGQKPDTFTRLTPFQLVRARLEALLKRH